MAKNAILFTFITFLVSCSTSNFNNIEGVWFADGYSCENATNLTEKIRIDKEDNTYFAIKLTGDNCISDGDTTWFGEIKGDKLIGRIKGVNSLTREFVWHDCEIYENLDFHKR